jgi:hypothetical protein
MIVKLVKQTVKVSKNNEVREIKASRLQEYLSAGWQQSSDKHGEEVIRLKPPAKKSKAAEPIAEEQANDNIQGE